MSQRWIELLQRRRGEHRGTDRVLNIAHRGARAFAPENTIEAIDKAAELGADMVELDVHLSRDGELVIMHDLKDDLTLSEIQTRDPRIPTLEECVARAQILSLLVNVEIKNLPRRYPQIEEKVVAVIERLDAVHQALVSSFDHESLAVVRQLNNRLATAVLTEDRLYQPLECLMRLDADALHPGGDLLDRDMIQAIRSSGRGVNVWTENDPDRMHHFIHVGATGIVTDYPNRLRHLLDATARRLATTPRPPRS
jgi:glycerophosphoryl diester phosphodiesterase